MTQPTPHTTLPKRKIGGGGKDGKEVSEVTAIGFGSMGMSAFYGSVEGDEQRLKVLDAAYENGCTFWDTADVYNDSEELIGKWFKKTGKRNDIFLATKFGFEDVPNQIINGKPEYVRASAERSLKRLGVDSIDLYYFHRADVNTPIEVTVKAMAELVHEGKVKHLGLSEVTSSNLRRAHAVHPIAALQVEYSPFVLDIEDPKLGVLETCRELGVAVVAYSPLGNGLLTGRYKSPDDFEQGDYRRMLPRFSKENFPKVLKLADGLHEIGKRHNNATAGQVALAWLLAQGEDIIPIPGTKKIKYLEENVKAAFLKLSSEEVGQVRGYAAIADSSDLPRYPVGMKPASYVDTPPLL